MSVYNSNRIPKTDRITKLVEDLYAKLPEIESARAKLVTESYRATEDKPLILRRALAFNHICENIPITIRDKELIVGSTTLAPRGCQTYPEFSFDWLEKEFDTCATREADPFTISKQAAAEIVEANKYWKGRTTSELAFSYMRPETKKLMAHNVFTTGNYFYNGVGHVNVKYWEIIESGFSAIIERCAKEIEGLRPGDATFAKDNAFLQAVIISCNAAITYAKRYSRLAGELAAKESDANRRSELLRIADVCERVPAFGARDFHEACQAFWFIQQLLQLESSGHSISPGRFDQYMYPYYKASLDSGKITREQAQELVDCIWVKLNDLNKCRDQESAKGFAGYSLFQNLIVGGQDRNGEDATNDLSFMCIEASFHVFLPMPSLSIRVWNGSPHELLVRAAELTRSGIGLPAYYNDEVIIPSLMSRGVTLEDARDYCIIGCVEPQAPGKTWGWHDAAFFNMLRPMELTFNSGFDMGEQVGPATKDVADMTTFEELWNAYDEQMKFAIAGLVDSDNCIDQSHAERMPLPFLSSMLDDCIARRKTPEQGGCIYNFTGPQGFGIANVADAMFAIKKLVFEEKKFTLAELKEAMRFNYGEALTEYDIAQITSLLSKELMANGVNNKDALAAAAGEYIRLHTDSAHTARYKEIKKLIDAQEKYGNDMPAVDEMARQVAYVYTKELPTYTNPRGGIFQAGLYPVSANVPLGVQTGASPDGRLSSTPLADGVSPSAGKDVNGPTAACNSVSKLDHGIASNGTLYNQKFHPSALSGVEGLNKFVGLIRTYFDRKGMHMQFNVVSKETLLDAQKHPENYKHLVVRVAGYSALFTTLSKSLQDDIIRRTEHGF